MKKHKRLLSIGLTFMLLFSMTQIAFAENWYSVPNVPVIQQAKTQWCWAAAGEMAGKAFDPYSTKNQTSGVYYVRGNYLNEPGYSREAAAVAQYVCSNKKTFYVNQYTWSMSNIRRDIMTYKSPLIFLAGYYDNYGNRNGGHFVTGDAVYEVSNYLRYKDSWDATTHWCTYSSFSDGSYNGRQYEETIYAR